MPKPLIELVWPGKHDDLKPYPCQLVEEPEFAYPAPSDTSARGFGDNRVICGDNLPALALLAPEFTGRFRCAYLDPPYNTGNTFRHYADRADHATWLTRMRACLFAVRPLLRLDGSVWISIDDREAHYLKVVCDEVFGRCNFVGTVVWQKRPGQANDAKHFSTVHEYLLIYARDHKHLRLHGLPRNTSQLSAYRNPDNDPRGPWKPTALHARSGRDTDFSYTFKNGVTWRPPKGSFPAFSVESLRHMDAAGEIWFGGEGTRVPCRKSYLARVRPEVVTKSLWLGGEVGQAMQARAEAKALCPDDPFVTPKPERLLQRVLQAATATGDWVLDPFAGSGTTGAVAHKMRRRYVLIEQGAVCTTHLSPRLQRVIDGRDPGGITEEEGWQGGGDVRFFRIAPARRGTPLSAERS